MLARYRIVRGARSPDDPLPDGVRQDTRKHTRHVLRPSPELVSLVLEDPSAQGFARFRRGYQRLLEQRFTKERERFDELAELAGRANVYLGCNCPTGRQRDVQHCHTVLALDFMRVHYPTLFVRFPER
jgi:uncharacterized protein YeaO (DUF488 family)